MDHLDNLHALETFLVKFLLDSPTEYICITQNHDMKNKKMIQIVNTFLSGERICHQMMERLENISKANKGRKENKTKRSKDYSNHIWSLPGGIEECPVCDELHKWKDQATGKENTCYRLSNYSTFVSQHLQENRAH